MTDVTSTSNSSFFSFVRKETEAEILPVQKTRKVCSICIHSHLSYCTLSDNIPGVPDLPSSLYHINPYIQKLLKSFDKTNFQILCNSCAFKLKKLAECSAIFKNKSFAKTKRDAALQDSERITAYFKGCRSKHRWRKSHELHDSNRSLSSAVSMVSVQEARTTTRKGGDRGYTTESSFELESQEILANRSENINSSQEAGPSGVANRRRGNLHSSQEAGPSRVGERRRPSTSERNTYSEEESDEENRRQMYPPGHLAHVGPKIKKTRNRPRVSDDYLDGITGG